MNKQEKIYKQTLGENIRKIRKRTKLTQDAFSEIIGIEPSSLSNIENGKSFPSALTLIQIQEKFKIHPEEIFDIEFISDKKIEEEIHEKISMLDFEKKKIIWKIVNSLNY